MGQEEGPLVPIEIKLSSEYKSESETSTGSALLLYNSSLSIPPPLLSVPTNSPPSYHYNMSQHDNLEQMVCQQQEQITIL